MSILLFDDILLTLFGKDHHMEWWNRKSLTIIVAASMLMYSAGGCENSNLVLKHLKKYASLPFADAATFGTTLETLHHAATLSLQRRGFTLATIDPGPGVLIAEMESPHIIPEEEVEHPQRSKESSVGSALLTFLGIVLVIGVVASLVSSPTKDDAESSETSRAADEEYQLESNSPTSVTYKYVVTLTTVALTDSTSDMRIEATKIELENGEVCSSSPFENKYLNYSIFDEVQKELDKGGK